MPQFELFIPALDETGFNVTARIEADNWMHALRNGLTKLGEGVDVRNVLCDITADGIDVTEPQSGRVFRIKELSGAAAAPAPAPVPAAPAPADPAAAVQPEEVPLDRPAFITAAPTPVKAAPGASPAPAAAPSAPAALSVPTPATTSAEQITRQRASESPRVAIGRIRKDAIGRPVEDLIVELFEETAELHSQPDVAAAANMLIDLAMKVIPADSGSVYVADINRSDLFFAAARGPKADEVMKFRVAIGQGLVGFSAQEGVGLAVSDAQRDPRFFSAISEKLGYSTHSILCSPSQRDGRLYGALQLINKKGNSTFTGDEMNLLSYLAHQFAEYLESAGQAGV
ncbi:MAG: GAF domain-containing protein [Myxococcota bacterium]